MPTKERNCRCAICQLEHDLLDSLSSQTARIQFQALATRFPLLSQFDSPADLLAQLRKQKDFEVVNDIARNAVLNALVNSIGDGITEETGQQLLLLAFMPAIHGTYAEVRQLFSDLRADDTAQQALLVFLEALRLPVVTHQSDYLPVALAKEFRRRLFRWAFSETRKSVPYEEISSLDPEPASDEDFEDAVLLEDLLWQWQRAGALSQGQCDLLYKFKCEGFEANELVGMDTGPTTNAVQMRLKRIVKRLRSAAAASEPAKQPRERKKSKNISTKATIFAESMAISNK
jgi:hypothetical protein